MPERPGPIAGVVFDMDGVLLDSEQVWDAVRQDLVAETGGTWVEGAHHDMMGMSSHEWPPYMRDRLGVPMTPAEISAEVVRRLSERYRASLPLLPGAAGAVRRMAREWPLAVASSSNRELIELALALAGVRECFAAVVSSEEVPRGKPAPDVYLEAAARIGAPAAACAAVEDSSNGIRAAAAAGMRVVVIPNAHYPPDPSAVALGHVIVTAVAGLTPDVVARTADAP
jgi:HAD superfamily hydrolase (TIGR01509 family)